MATEDKLLYNELDVREILDEGKSRTSKTKKKKSASRGMSFHRINTEEGVSPYDQVEWVFRNAEITTDTGSSIFRQDNVEIPTGWSTTALNIVASKYFHGALDTPERETSVRQLVSRVADTIADWGVKDSFFRTVEDSQIFRDELTHLLLTQKAAFNSPVWFNCGVEKKPQCSACFINSVDDTLDSILDLAKIEGMLFKYGSGTGTNLSSLRSSREPLSSGGIASGPVSFMKGYDAFAGVIKSGGKTRRAAKMVILDIEHPDIVEFIESKTKEERKAWALIDAGYDASLNGEAYGSVFFQNANHSVRVSDKFMRAAEKNEEWHTLAVTTGEKVGKYQARDLLRTMAESAWQCGDPGIQYDSTINQWHTCKTTDRIYSSNPCSEYMFLDNTACNLASLNLMKFIGEDGKFDVERFRHAVDILITAQEIIVDNAGYPHPEIEENSHRFRPLGLGYANLGALLMYSGIPYDSDKGRNFAAAITAIMSGQAYLSSARNASELGPFHGYAENSEPMLEIIKRHRKAVDQIAAQHVPEYLSNAAHMVWKEAEAVGREHGYRNAQTTVLAPTGTIGLLMDCDTTGIEPDMALIKYKVLAGGGTMKLVNTTVPAALKRLGYDPFQIDTIVEYIDEKGTIEGAPHLDKNHLPVFDCALQPVSGSRFIHYMGHVKMIAAVQPFLSGAISKTVNLPNEISVEEIEHIYIDAWKRGVKAISVYRDGCKRIQPLSTSQGEVAQQKSDTSSEAATDRPRHRLPSERQSITHKFEVGSHEGYITVGLYENGEPGEIFLVMAKEGSTVSGLMDCFATAISMALQYGVPLNVLINKFAHTRFEPSGWTRNKQIPHAKSVMDYIFRWLAQKFLSREEQDEIGVVNYDSKENHIFDEVDIYGGTNGHTAGKTGFPFAFHTQDDAPTCPDCGLIMVRNGTCYKCMNCGTSSGCS